MKCLQNIVFAGFPSIVQDYKEHSIDLNTILVKNPSSTFFVSIRGNSMESAGIFDRDDLLVDRSLVPVEGSIVVAVVDQQFVCKRLKYKNKELTLVSENNKYPNKYPDINSKGHDIQIWGVATLVLHKLVKVKDE